jgi:DNA-directed RNA polymerase subunit RPC12/RpoP
MICIRCGWKMKDHSRLQNREQPNGKWKITEFTVMICPECGHKVEI